MGWADGCRCRYVLNSVLLTPDRRLAMTLNVVALSALQGFAGNLVKLHQKLSAEPDIQPGTVSSLEKLLRLQSEKSSLQDRLSSLGVNLDKLESALTGLASDPSLSTFKL